MSDKLSGPSQTQKDLLRYLLQKREIISIIVDGLRLTLSQHTKTETKTGKPYLRESAAEEGITIAGVIRLQGQDFSATLLLGFSKKTFLRIYENMFEEAAENISTENQDLAGELLNIAFGVMNPELTKLGYKLKSSFPKVLTGSTLEERLKKVGSGSVVIPFQAKDDEFYLEIFASVDGEV